MNKSIPNNPSLGQTPKSLRDEFAMAALIGLGDRFGLSYETTAKLAYALADAMMAERAK